mmetsp:Transcript_19945/g.41068  ORF Transcript_19945/g.41068 Transcript_19945/m.41068 type:complete len:212 (+) Transcript_19945:386-1021(+)
MTIVMTVRIIDDTDVIVMKLKLRFCRNGRIQSGPASEFMISTFAIALTLADGLTSTLALILILTLALANAPTETGAPPRFVRFPTSRAVPPSSRRPGLSARGFVPAAAAVAAVPPSVLAAAGMLAGFAVAALSLGAAVTGRRSGGRGIWRGRGSSQLFLRLLLLQHLLVMHLLMTLILIFHLMNLLLILLLEQSLLLANHLLPSDFLFQLF